METGCSLPSYAAYNKRNVVNLGTDNFGNYKVRSTIISLACTDTTCFNHINDHLRKDLREADGRSILGIAAVGGLQRTQSTTAALAASLDESYGRLLYAVFKLG